MMLVLAIWTQNRSETGCRVCGLEEIFGRWVRRGAGVRGMDPAAHDVSLTDEYQLDVPPCWRQVLPAAPRPGQARTGAVSVAYARAEQFVFNLGKPSIAGVNE